MQTSYDNGNVNGNLNIQILSSKLVFAGTLDETVSVDPLLEMFKKARNGSAPVEVDLSNVKYANSSGILAWLKSAYGSGVRMKYVNAPVWLVNQFNSIRGYFENKSYVESFFAPFYCENTEESIHVLLRVGVDIPVQQDYSKFQIKSQEKEGKSFAPDFESAHYFSFISRHFQNFQNMSSSVS